MGTNSFIELKIPEAQNLADLNGVIKDLHSAIKYAKIVLKIFNSESSLDHFELVSPISEAALVKYSRPFSSGVRQGLREHDLAFLPDELISKHDYFIDWRNKHVAHAVNSFELDIPTARYWVERVQNEGFTSIGFSSVSIHGLSALEAEQLIDLSTRIIDSLEDRVEVEKKTLLDFVRSKSVDYWLKQDDEASWPKREDVNKSRRKGIK